MGKELVIGKRYARFFTETGVFDRFVTIVNFDVFTRSYIDDQDQGFSCLGRNPIFHWRHYLEDVGTLGEALYA